jgi:hypothetical protein
LFADKQLDQACAKFAESLKKASNVNVAFELAACYAAQGKTATAWAEFGSVASKAQRQGDGQLAEKAQANKSELEPKIPFLLIRSAAASGTAITLDDKPVDGAMLDLPLPIDPGPHVVAASAAGKKPWRQTLEAPSHKTEIFVQVPVLQDQLPATPASEPPSVPEAKAPPVPTPPAAPVSSADQTEPGDAPPGGISPLVWVGFGLAGVGAVVGGITGGLTLSKAGEVKDNCVESFCPPEQEDALSSATTLANVTNVMLAVGGVGLGLGVIGLAMSDFGEGGGQADAAQLEVFVGPSSGGIRGRF